MKRKRQKQASAAVIAKIRKTKTHQLLMADIDHLPHIPRGTGSRSKDGRK